MAQGSAIERTVSHVTSDEQCSFMHIGLRLALSVRLFDDISSLILPTFLSFVLGLTALVLMMYK